MSSSEPGIGGKAGGVSVLMAGSPSVFEAHWGAGRISDGVIEGRWFMRLPARY
jgi:hypothetical protein